MCCVILIPFRGHIELLLWVKLPSSFVHQQNLSAVAWPMSQDLLWLIEHQNNNILQIKQSVSWSSIKTHYHAQLEIKQNPEQTQQHKPSWAWRCPSVCLYRHFYQIVAKKRRLLDDVEKCFLKVFKLHNSIGTVSELSVVSSICSLCREVQRLGADMNPQGAKCSWGTMRNYSYSEAAAGGAILGVGILLEDPSMCWLQEPRL